MNYTNITEANKRITELEALLSVKKTQGTRIVAKDAIEMSSKFLNIPFGFAKILDAEGRPRTPLAYAEDESVPIEYNHNKSRAVIWFEFSDLDNDYSGVKAGIKHPDLAQLFNGVQPSMQGELNSILETDVRILNYSKYKEFKKVNDNWKTSEIV